MTTEQIQSIPTEKGWPLLGILPKLLIGDPFEYLKQIMLKRGDFVLLKLGPQAVYLVSNPDYLQRIFRDNYQNYPKPSMLYDTAKEVLGKGLALSSGELWLRQRRMIQPHLHRKQLANLFSDMVDAVSEIINEWDVLAENSTPIELSEKMKEVTINVITHTMFGKGMLTAAQVTDIDRRITQISTYNGETAIYASMLPKWVPIPGRRQFEQDLSSVKETIHQVILKCREGRETSASLIQMLFNSVDEESHEQMTEQQLFDEVMTIFIAGYETVATVLTWLGVVIYNNPEVLAKLQAEIEQVLGGRTPSFDDVPRLIYTRQVFMEVMRMYTVVPFLPRALTNADQLGSYDLPAKAVVLAFYHGVHHNPKFWDNPEVFDPGRFTPEKMANQHSFAYIPFSAGPRKCAGDEFALLEGPLMIAMILQKYDLNILPNQKFSAKMASMMSPKKGVKISLSKRNSP